MTTPVVSDRRGGDPVLGSYLDTQTLAFEGLDLGDLGISELASAFAIADRDGWFDGVEVTPGRPDDGVVDSGSSDTERLGDGLDSFARTGALAGLDHDGISEDGGVVGFTTLVGLPSGSSSGSFVRTVSGPIPVVEMTRPDTWRVIAGMAGDNRHSSGLKHQDDPRGIDGPVDFFSWRGHLEVAISIRMSGGSPLPAGVVIVHDLDLGPEPVLQSAHGNESAEFFFSHHGDRLYHGKNWGDFTTLYQAPDLYEGRC